MQISKYITIDPKICHGKPCFKGTRILVYTVLEMLASGETQEEILKDAYPQLTKRHIEAALGYAAHTAQEGRIVSLMPHAIAR
jgi:uncharacterized protein (DUF433 family)